MPVTSSNPRLSKQVGGWLAGLGILYAIIAVEFRAAPEVALQHWSLLSIPLILAAFRFGFRGSLAASFVSLGLILLVFTWSTESFREATGFVQDLMGGTASAEDASRLAFRLADLRATDPQTSAVRGLLGLVISIVGSILLGRAVDYRDAAAAALRRTVQAVSRYCAPPVVRAIATATPAAERGIAPARRDITVLFADLRGFTALSESLDPEEVAQLLNEFFEAATDEVLRHGGTLDKYIGDAVMAFFDDPESETDHTVAALKAGLAMQERMRQLQARWRSEGRFGVGLGVGVAAGYATVGVTGSQSRQQYTAIGNTVNVAARLCDLAREGQVLTTRKSYRRAGHVVDGIPRGSTSVKGFTRPLEIVEAVGVRVLAPSAAAETDVRWVRLVARIFDDPTFRATLLSGGPEAIASEGLDPREEVLARHLSVLVGSPTFQGLPPEEVAILTRAAAVEEFAAGATIVEQGADAEHNFYILLQGQVAVIAGSADQLVRHVASLSTGDHFGEMALLFDTPRGATVRAVAPATCLVLHRERFYALLDEAPVFRARVEAAARARLTDPVRPPTPTLVGAGVASNTDGSRDVNGSVSTG